MSRPRVVFMGTPGFAVPALRAVAEACEVALVVSQPDRARGRGRRTAPPAVAEAARELGLPLWQPETLKGAEPAARLAATRADLFAVVAYGEILSRAALAAPRLGAINLHASLLPAYRGAAPVQRAIWEGQASTGVTTMWMDEGLDTGDLILQAWTPIEPSDDAGTLARRLASLGAPLLAASLALAHQGRAPRVPQPARGASHAKKLAKEDGLVDWSLSALEVWNRARAMTPWPGATTGFAGRRLVLLETRPRDLLPAAAPPGAILEIGAAGLAVACGAGALLIERLKPEGRAAMGAAAWARGARLAAGDRLTLEKENAA